MMDNLFIVYPTEKCNISAVWNLFVLDFNKLCFPVLNDPLDGDASIAN